MSAGSTSFQLNASDAFGDAFEIRSIIDANKYFIGSSDSWNRVLDGVVHCDLALCALGGLISHLSRLMVRTCILI